LGSNNKNLSQSYTSILTIDTLSALTYKYIFNGQLNWWSRQGQACCPKK